MTAPTLPAPRGTPYRIGLVCLGNICRSPTAAVVLEELVNRAGLSAKVAVSSAGTGPWHVGEPMDARAAATLRAEGFDPSAHRGQQVDRAWLDLDLLLAVDSANLDGVRRLGPGEPDRVRLFRDFDPTGSGDVPDPYYGGPDGFDDVLAMVERTSIALVDGLTRLLR